MVEGFYPNLFTQNTIQLLWKIFMNDSVDSDTFLLSSLNSKILGQKYRDNKIGLLTRIQCPEANKKQAPIGEPQAY